jgi:hypothetical protein
MIFAGCGSTKAEIKSKRNGGVDEGRCFPPYPRKSRAAKVGHPRVLIVQNS